MQSIEVPVVAYPLRGRINPYFWYLIPLIALTIAASLLTLGSLLAVWLTPINWMAVPGIFKAAIIVAIVVYSLALALCILLAASYTITIFNIFDTQYIQILLDLINLIATILLIIASCIAVAAESNLECRNDDAHLPIYSSIVHRGALLTAGILGYAAALLLIITLLLSRFYQFCIGNYKHQKRELLKAAELAKNFNGA